MSTIQPLADDLFSKLETRAYIIQDIKAKIHEKLNQTKDSSYLNSLVDYYMINGNNRCLEVLVGIREPHDKHLFDKLSDCLKGPSRHRSLTLLSYIAHKQPTWFHKISQHSLLPSIIKVLKTDSDGSILMTGVLLLVTLFQIIPHTIGFNHITDACEIFTRLATMCYKKQDLPDVILMHLHVAIYALFHRFYSLFPCNFLNYLRNYCIGNRDHAQVFNETIRPMMDHVRMHPLLVTCTKDAETSPNRWKYKETHDIVVDCARLSLDATEGTREDVLFPDRMTTTLIQFCNPLEEDIFPPGNSSIPRSIESILENSCDLGAFSPSVACSLFTPLPQPSPELEIADVSTEQTAFVTPELAPGKIQGTKKESKAVPSAARSKDSVATTAPSLPTHSDSAVKTSVFRLHRSDSLSKSEGLFQPKARRIPLSKSSSATTYASLHHCEDQSESKSEKPDAADVEVEGIFAHTNCSSVDDGALRITPVAEGSRSGRGSGQWCQSPYYEYLNEAQRGRSYSQGRPIPRRATVEIPCDHVVSRANSMPNIAQPEQPVVYLSDDKKGDQTCELQPLRSTSHLLYAALPQNMHLASLNKSSTCRSIMSSFLQLSPPEILDRFLLKCEETLNIKSNQPSSSGPCHRSSKHGTSEEVNILQNQRQLLHSQLLYERNKREIHAERNRRLLRKAKCSKVLEEQYRSTKNQIKLLEDKNAKESLFRNKLRLDHSNNLESKDLEHQKLKTDFRSITQEKEKLEKQASRFEKLIVASKEETGSLKKQIEKSQSDLFNCVHELKSVQDEVRLNTHLKSEIVKLTRELLLMSELNKKYSDNITSLQSNINYESEISSLHNAYDREISLLRGSLETRDAQLESTISRSTELESLLLKKDKIIAEQKKLLNNCKEEYELQLKAMEEKYKQRGSICQLYEADILRLLAKLEEQSLSKYSDEEDGAVGGIDESVNQACKGYCDKASGEFKARRASEPIDIVREPDAVNRTESRSHHHRLDKVEQRFKKRYEDEFGEIPESDHTDKSSSDELLGVIESVTPKSLASIADDDDTID